MARPKFMADADVPQDLIDELCRREREINFLIASVAGTRGPSDPQVLGLAADDGRILVSCDRNTMPHHFKAFIFERDSPGLIVVEQKASFARILR